MVGGKMKGVKKGKPKLRKPKPFDYIIGSDNMKYCRHHKILMIFHPKALTEYCPKCWMEGHKPKCDV